MNLDTPVYTMLGAGFNLLSFFTNLFILFYTTNINDQNVNSFCVTCQINNWVIFEDFENISCLSKLSI